MSKQKSLINDWPIWLVLLLPFVLTIYHWADIPDQIAMHWNGAGEVDRWGEKGWEAFLLPVINVGVYLLLIALPYIDPKKKTDNAQKAMRAFRYILPVFFSGFAVLILYKWLGSDFELTSYIYLSMTALFLLMGNYMQTIKPNYFLGIRTPWTLESEENWRKTHRFGGRLWVAGSLVMLILWFFLPTEKQTNVLFYGTIGMTVVILLYSFALYMMERGEAPEKETHEQEAG